LADGGEGAIGQVLAAMAGFGLSVSLLAVPFWVGSP
jgi:hypothetical protein